MGEKTSDRSKSSGGVVYAALIGNILVALTKAGAAFMTGSSGMISEAIHSFIDTGNEMLLLYGMRRSKRKPDPVHPLGFGRELYFWSFIVALFIFAVGATASFYQGIVHLRSPEPVERPIVNYIVLGLSLLFEGGSWLVAFRAFRAFRASKGSLGYWQAVRRSKDPPKFIVLLEDSAAILGILIALAGTWLSVVLDEPRYDGIASLAIGLLLAAVSVVLARESMGLLIGERADPDMQKSIVETAGQVAGISRVNGIMTSQISPLHVVAGLSIEFDAGLSVSHLERIIEELEVLIRERHPEITALFVKPQSDESFQSAYRHRFGQGG